VAQDVSEDEWVPVWARDEAFPAAPPGFGWVDFKGRLHHAVDEAALIEAIREDKSAGVSLVWTPALAWMRLPEELTVAAAAVIEARRRRAGFEQLDAADRMRWFGLLFGLTALWLGWQAWRISPQPAVWSERLHFAIQAVTASVSVGIALLMFLMFACIPWYQSRKQAAAWRGMRVDDLAARTAPLRFEAWLELQRAPVTRLLLGIIALAGVAQLLPGESLMAAGLIKDRYLSGEWWRLFTAPMLHGNPLHFLMNAAALLYLGKRVEVFARWPHVPLVFLFSACVGGEASARFLDAPTVGASGGLMGWLGFLLVFEALHGRLVPRKATRRLLAGLILTGLIGVIGYRFIDNAAHAGGCLAGMLYAVVVFPKSASAMRPRTTFTDRIAGSLALLALLASAAFTAWIVTR